MGLTLAQWCAVFGVVALGALAQSVVGFGLNLIAAPIVGIVAPELMPAAMVVINVPLSLTIAARGARFIDWNSVGWTTLGRLPGTAAGALLVSAVSARTLGAIVGVGVLAACIVASLSAEFRVGRRTAFVAGSASGLMDTTAAVGGPPLALLYQHRPPHEVRATLSASFLIGTVLSLGALFLGGEVTSSQMLASASLMPAIGLGMLIALPATKALGNRPLRPAVLGLSGVAGLSALVDTLIG